MSLCQRTESKMKNSGSGPKNAVSAMPVDLRYASARLAIERGSREYACMVLGSSTSQVRINVGCAVNGSRTAVDGSGISTMSESLMPFQPVIDEPSNILPSSNSRRIDGVGGKRDVMLLAEHVGEAQIDELDLVLLDQIENFVGHGNLAGRRPAP